jgi:50S ribosome-binding GTPase
MILSVSAWTNPVPSNIRLDSFNTRRWNGSVTKQSTSKRASSFPPSKMIAKEGEAEGKKNVRRGPKKSKKLQIAETITPEHMDRLAAAFDALARKEGFDASTQHFASDATFEDEFDDDDFMDDDDFDDDVKADGLVDYPDDALLLDPKQFQVSDFSGELDDDDDDLDDDDDISFSGNDEDDDMEARIAAARSDMQSGRVTVPKELDQRASDLILDPSVLGFRKEEDPWGIDEKHRKREDRYKEFQLVSNALVCSACGADFQSSNEKRPGYLPSEKFATQVKLSKLEELQRLQAKAGNDKEEWSPEDEVEWLIQTAGSSPADSGTAQESSAELDLAALAEEMGLDLETAQKRVICKRCHGLQNFGTVETVLRPGWTEEPLLSQEKFRDLLRPIREKPAVVIALVDLFDFSGSVLPELDNIAGENPVIVAANKADLLPAKMGQVRAENWVRRELEYMGIRSLANVGGAVRLVSCKTGYGVGGMLAKARELANEIDGDIYVVGAANAGKSTLLNYILGPEEASGSEEPIKFRAGNRNKRKSAITTSPLPGTTLKFIKVDIGDGRSLYDTPGLLVQGTLTQLLTPDELKIVVPKK